MSSDKFLKIAKNIVKEDKELFDNLMEFEETKKLNTKTRLNFTISKSLAAKFRRYCKDKGYNMSAKIEQAINNLINKE